MPKCQAVKSEIYNCIKLSSYSPAVIQTRLIRTIISHHYPGVRCGISGLCLLILLSCHLSPHCSAVWCGAEQCIALQCIAMHCTAMQSSAVQCDAVQSSTVHCSAVQYRALQCTAPHHTALNSPSCIWVVMADDSTNAWSARFG